MGAQRRRSPRGALEASYDPDSNLSRATLRRRLDRWRQLEHPIGHALRQLPRSPGSGRAPRRCSGGSASRGRSTDSPAGVGLGVPIRVVGVVTPAMGPCSHLRHVVRNQAPLPGVAPDVDVDVVATLVTPRGAFPG